MNIILIALEIVITLVTLYIFYKKYKQDGLYLYSILAYILAILVSIKNIQILTFEIPLGIVLITTIYIVNNILVQKNGMEVVKKQLGLLTITGIITISLIFLSIAITPSTLGINDFNIMFIEKIRIVLITMIIPILGIWLNSKLYYQLKRETNNMLICNLLSALIIYFIESSIYTLLIFSFIIPFNEIFVTITIIYIIKIIVAVFGTIVIYQGRKIKDK